MKNLLLTIIVSLAAFVTAHAQSSQYGAIEDFYQADPDLNTSQYAGRVVNPSYWLVDWGRWSEMDDRLVSNGFIRLGVSKWESDNAYGGGIPQREPAIGYAQAIGADVVIYATHAAADKYNYSEHLIGFYARRNAQRAVPTTGPSNAQASLAMNRLQDALGKPRVKVCGTIRVPTRTTGSAPNSGGVCRSQPANF